MLKKNNPANIRLVGKISEIYLQHVPEQGFNWFYQGGPQLSAKSSKGSTALKRLGTCARLGF